MATEYEVKDNRLTIKTPSVEIKSYTKEELTNEKANIEARLAEVKGLLEKFV